MSDPYQYPSGQYPPSQYHDPNAQYQGGYQQQPQYGAYPPQGYDQNYPQQPQGGQPGYPPGPEGFGPPRRQDSFGPPMAGGFQHGQQGGQFGAYDASNPQGHMGYFGGAPPQDTRGYDGSPAPQGHGQLQQQYYDPNDPNQQHQYGAGAPVDPNAPYNPNAPEGERGLGGSLAGGAAGYFLGRKKNHGFLGTVGGAILGNFIEDKLKDKKHSGHGNGSSWGGKW